MWLGSEIEEVQALHRINPFHGLWRLAAGAGLAAAGCPGALESIIPRQPLVGEDDDDATRMAHINAAGKAAGFPVRKPSPPVPTEPIPS